MLTLIQNLIANNTLDTPTLRQLLIEHSIRVRQWYTIGALLDNKFRWQLQFSHRWNRYRYRLNILRENNSNNLTATDELMTKYLQHCKVGPN